MRREKAGEKNETKIAEKVSAGKNLCYNKWENKTQEDGHVPKKNGP